MSFVHVTSLSLALRVASSPNLDGITRRGNVVHTQDIGTVAHRNGRRSHAGVDPVSRFPIRYFSKGVLPLPTRNDGETECAQRLLSRQQGEILRNRLTEPNTGV